MNGGGNGAETHRASVSGAGQPAEREKKTHPHKHQQNGAARLGIIHSGSSTGELEENSESIWLGILSNVFLSHEILPSLARYRDLWTSLSRWLILSLALSDLLSVSRLSHYLSHSLDFSLLSILHFQSLPSHLPSWLSGAFPLFCQPFLFHTSKTDSRAVWLSVLHS